MATMKQIRRANSAAGEQWFSDETMRFWRSKIEGSVIAGAFFVTSEDNFDRTRRLFTVRQALPNGRIATVGGFQEHTTYQQALQAALDAAQETTREKA